MCACSRCDPRAPTVTTSSAFAVCLVLGAWMLFVRWMPVDVLPSSKGHSSRRSQRVPEPAIDPMNAGRLKVLILRGEMRCRPIDLCTEYWRRYIIVNNVDEVYIVTPRNVSGKPILLYHGEAWGEPRDPHYTLVRVPPGRVRRDAIVSRLLTQYSRWSVAIWIAGSMRQGRPEDVHL
jgi:hypothetical protein